MIQNIFLMFSEAEWAEGMQHSNLLHTVIRGTEGVTNHYGLRQTADIRR